MIAPATSPSSAYRLAELHAIACAAVAVDWPAAARRDLAALLTSIAVTLEDAAHRDELRDIAKALRGEFRVPWPTPPALVWSHHA